MLILGLILFLGIHLVGIETNDGKNTRFKKPGVVTWKAIYSLTSIFAVALMAVGFIKVI